MSKLMDLAKSHISGSPKPEGNGLDCYFYKLTPTIGLKTYYDEETRNTAYSNQVMLHSHDLAPEAFDKFDLHSNSDINDDDFEGQDYRYCYVTQLAELIQIPWGGDTGIDYTPEIANEFGNRMTNYRMVIVNKLEKLGFYATDLHGANYGLLDGKPVIIDTVDIYPL